MVRSTLVRGLEMPQEVYVDLEHFDAVTRLLDGLSRRQIFGAAVGGLSAVGLRIDDPLSTEAKRKKRKKKKKKKLPTGCAPQCGAKVCGSDGCDGSCGTCAEGANCSAQGQCIDPNAYEFVDSWGVYGEDEGEFRAPVGIAFHQGNSDIYVADAENHRVQRFSTSGEFQLTWGSEGGDPGEFEGPQGLAVASDGAIFVTDQLNHRVQKFSSNGNFITAWGTEGGGNSQFFAPQGVAVDSEGAVFVADTFNDRIQKFVSNAQNPLQYDFVTKWGSNGIGDGEFDLAVGVALDRDGRVYVLDSSNHRIQVFAQDAQDPLLYNLVKKIGSFGNGVGEFNSPRGIALDEEDNIFVCDTSNDRIQKFDTSGVHLASCGSTGDDDGEFIYPQAVAIDDAGAVYVVDNANRVQKFAPAGGAARSRAARKPRRARGHEPGRHRP